MQQPIVGKDGRCYNLTIAESDSMFLMRLYDRQILVGEARCVQESSDTFFIGDISIANAVIAPPIDVPTNLRSKHLRYRPRPINYRSRGLGSALLRCLIDHAHAKGAQYLYGDVFRQDVENNPNLLQWYQKHGFEIKPLESDEKPDVVAIVHLSFKPSSNPEPNPEQSQSDV